MKYSPAGAAAAVDAALPVVCAWHSDSTVTVDFIDSSTLRALAVAIQEGAHQRAFQTLGARPFDRYAQEELLPKLRGDGRIAAALTQTFTVGDAEILRDALTDAIAELGEAPGDYREDAP